MNANLASQMATETAEQPAILRRLIERRDDIRAALYRTMPVAPRGITLLGRGTSANAALYGRFVLELAVGAPSSLFPPSLATLYPTHADYRGFLAIGLSQSGRTRDIRQALRTLKAFGATTVVITADPTTRVAHEVDLCLDIGAGLERAVPATKTFTAELAMLAMIAEGMSDIGWSAGDWEAMADSVEAVLEDEEGVVREASSLNGVSQLSVIAGGLLAAIAAEGALKIEEVARIAAEGMSSESYRHGPMTLADASHPVIALVGRDHGRDETLRAVRDLRAEGVPVVLVASTDVSERVLSVPGGLSDALLAIPAAVRFQQLAVVLAQRRGLDPDRPRRLRKVTT